MPGQDTDRRTALSAAAAAPSASSAATRRAPLLAAMQRLGAAGVGCSACSGVCCTFVANSMQITQVEAIDIAAALASRGRLTAAEVERWRANTARFGLDRPLPGDGRRGLMRRRYTCPFFLEGAVGATGSDGTTGTTGTTGTAGTTDAGGALGCTLPPEAKPYGCLTYNARRAGVTGGEDCGSDQTLLDAVVVTADVRAAAQAWAGSAATEDLLPIPVALLRLLARAPAPSAAADVATT